MNCSNHFENKATNTCNVCGKWFCEDCVLEVDGRIYCKSCLKNKLSENTEKNTFSHKKHSEKQPSDLISLVLSLIPGCGQMYLGFIKRGILILILFIALASIIYPLSIVLWIFSFFDTFKLKNDLQKGIYIEDDIKDIKSFVKDNKKILIASILLIVIPSIFYRISSEVMYILDNLIDFIGLYVYDEIFIIGLIGFSIIIGIIILAIFIKIFRKMFSKNKDIGKDKDIDIDKYKDINDRTN
ncbi:MAG: hypothetical protein K2F59_03125 [Eubacteriales bacterium]|nr:hypothetical protein [Eubacteriales bacterium]